MTADLPNWMWLPGREPEVNDDLMEKWLQAAVQDPHALKATMHKLVQHLSGGQECVVRAEAAEVGAEAYRESAELAKDAARIAIAERDAERETVARLTGAGNNLRAFVHVFAKGDEGMALALKEWDRAALPAVTQPAPDADLIREAALREAADVVDAELMRWGFPSTDGCKRDEMRTAILALITEKPNDRATGGQT